MSGDCVHCGHPAGTHHAGGGGDNACAVKGCDCYGFVAAAPVAMSRDIEMAVGPTPAALSPMDTPEQALLATYDFLKHMSTLAIVAVGGMLGLAQGVGAKVSPAILASVALVGLCGFLSLVFMTGVTATQIRQRVHKSSNGFALAMVVIVLMLFAGGIGGFIGAFLKQLSHSPA